ncbi:DegT/DnrJ/EryC1/StrS family aminotransferase [Halochromatium roseum]|uniref:DegT/DnrJ/EryC1/StrS family aminotransferase n=1 Tax=Halochromatium roseum TaxID=391920 RepID=UPI0019114164|nr:DegT/DnrJ/EryC1/StrS family aminotransferase [Halochromatium roseum]
MAFAHDDRLALIEDAAESLGSRYHGRQTGTFGLLGTLSLNGNKAITTGGGGAILTDDECLADPRQAPDHDRQASAPLGVYPRCENQG